MTSNTRSPHPALYVLLLPLVSFLLIVMPSFGQDAAHALEAGQEGSTGSVHGVAAGWTGAEAAPSYGEHGAVLAYTEYAGYVHQLGSGLAELGTVIANTAPHNC